MSRTGVLQGRSRLAGFEYIRRVVLLKLSVSAVREWEEESESFLRPFWVASLCLRGISSGRGTTTQVEIILARKPSAGETQCRDVDMGAEWLGVG